MNKLPIATYIYFLLIQLSWLYPPYGGLAGFHLEKDSRDGKLRFYESRGLIV